MKHTPGTWRANTYNGYIVSDLYGFVPIVSPFTDKANKDKHGAPTEEAAANMRLMAAAPDMLEALERIVREMKVLDPTTQFVFAETAIRKAKGEKG